MEKTHQWIERHVVIRVQLILAIERQVMIRVQLILAIERQVMIRVQLILAIETNTCDYITIECYTVTYLFNC